MSGTPASMHRAAIEAVAIGASAGGIDALLQLLVGLPGPWRVPVLVVLHLPDDHESRLVEVFAHRIRVTVEEARPGAPVVPGRLYFAPPGYHLLVEADRTFALSCEPPVLFSRPSIDVLLEACADVYGAALAGVVLTGANHDGAAGLAAVRQHGGWTAVQDPAEAAHAAMPLAAIEAAGPDHVLPLAQLREQLQSILCP
ncbi:MAG TPA: chemotaxis protein CheB [Ramlibacter sp.]|jgi:two-component system chemotaxis response regulator CheB|uniref:chemotaxis protein CheB n=1 Tax=Ramlibacter sp. TaxID=1917967 RepID=UPI002D5F9D41|nr:chemotaxis protein CheB [Ramlibacter sp.]HZY19069.1 chemotaxis protein CheB [Ramlibacter sp.]